jgi:hypothetical protein
VAAVHGGDEGEAVVIDPPPPELLLDETGHPPGVHMSVHRRLLEAGRQGQRALDPGSRQAVIEGVVDVPELEVVGRYIQRVVPQHDGIDAASESTSRGR